MPLGRTLGRPFTPLRVATSARSSAIACLKAAFSASSRSARASKLAARQARKADLLRHRHARHRSGPPRPSATASAYLGPAFCPSYPNVLREPKVIWPEIGDRDFVRLFHDGGAYEAL